MRAHEFTLLPEPQVQQVNQDGAAKLRFTGSEALAVIQFTQLAGELTRPRLQMYCASPTPGAMPHRYENLITHIVIDGKSAQLGLAHSTDTLQLHTDKTTDERRKTVSYVDTPLTSFPWEAYGQFRQQLLAEQRSGTTAGAAMPDTDAASQRPHFAPGKGDAPFTTEL